MHPFICRSNFCFNVLFTIFKPLAAFSVKAFKIHAAEEKKLTAKAPTKTDDSARRHSLEQSTPRLRRPRDENAVLRGSYLVPGDHPLHEDLGGRLEGEGRQQEEDGLLPGGGGVLTLVLLLAAVAGPLLVALVKGQPGKGRKKLRFARCEKVPAESMKLQIEHCSSMKRFILEVSIFFARRRLSCVQQEFGTHTFIC